MDEPYSVTLSADKAKRAFFEFIGNPVFPCVAAKAAVNGDVCRVELYDALAGRETTVALSRDLLGFVEENRDSAGDYSTFAAIFRGPIDLDERAFENLLWSQLTQLDDADAAHFSRDPTVSADPDDPHFGFSFAGRAFYVVGLHARSSREARRFRWPALVFNAHAQFRRIRELGHWQSMQRTIRARDERLQGSINPMISDFGENSEARQYSGRAVEEDWHAPFTPAERKCPFHR